MLSQNIALPLSYKRQRVNEESNFEPLVYKTTALPLSYSPSEKQTSRIGLEPTASRLTVARSTIELPRQKHYKGGGNRTHTKNFGDSRSTIKLPPLKNLTNPNYPLSDLNRHSFKEIDFESTASTIPPSELT